MVASMPRRWPRPKSRVGRIAFWISLSVIVCTLLRLILRGGAGGTLFSSLAVLGLLALTPLALILLGRVLNRHLLWKVRNRLIVTYVLMGLAPLVLFGTLIAIAGYIFAGQFSINSAMAGLDEAAEQLKGEASAIAELLTLPGTGNRADSLHFEQPGNPRLTEITAAHLQNGIWRTVQLATEHGVSPPSPFDAVKQVGWLQPGYHGVVIRQGKLYLCRVSSTTEDKRSAEVLTALELNQRELTAVGQSLGRVLVFSGYVGEHRTEMDDAEREAKSAEQEADRAETQRQRDQQRAQQELQRETQEALRDAQRDQAEDQREAQGQLRDAQRDQERAQRELDRAQAELAHARGEIQASPADREELQQGLQEAQAALNEAKRQMQSAVASPTAPASLLPPSKPAAPARPASTAHTAGHRAITPVDHAARSAATEATSGTDAAHAASDTSFTAVSGGALPASSHLLDPRVYFTAPFPVVGWQDGVNHSAILVVISRPSALYARLFSKSVDMGSLLRNVLIGIAIAFGFLELLALWMAFRLSGTITRSVADLYRGTTEIDAGNLTYRVRPQRQDQLGSLAGSFNRMAGSIQDLLVQQRERDRLLNELAIAQEVQQNLFPQSPIAISSLELHAVCLPARSVSGDYFDFIVGHNTLGAGTGACIALGDISGKGISAALLMATLHSAVRAFSLREGAKMPSSAEQLELLNQHLFSSTQPNRYATLFLAFYDAQSHRMTYANGGHLPPFLISADGTVRRLEVGGAVVGLLEDLHYEETTVELRQGDLLAAFTDGMTEPENADQQEFGEARLLSLLEQHRMSPLPDLAEAVFRELKDWIADQEQPDDMTLLLARQR